MCKKCSEIASICQLILCRHRLSVDEKASVMWMNLLYSIQVLSRALKQNVSSVTNKCVSINILRSPRKTRTPKADVIDMTAWSINASPGDDCMVLTLAFQWAWQRCDRRVRRNSSRNLRQAYNYDHYPYLHYCRLHKEKSTRTWRQHVKTLIWIATYALESPSWDVFVKLLYNNKIFFSLSKCTILTGRLHVQIGGRIQTLPLMFWFLYSGCMGLFNHWQSLVKISYQ